MNNSATKISDRIHAFGHSRRFWQTCLLLILTPAVLNFGQCTPREQRAIEDLNQRGVTISYSLTHLCGDIVTSDTPTDVPRLVGRFAVYTINSIDNQRPAAVAFDFEAQKLFLTTSPNSRARRSTGSAPGGSTRVAPGTIWTTGGRVIMRLDPITSPFPSATSGLEYQRLPGNPPVLMLARPSGTGVVRRDSCLQSTLPALPDFP
jgi:hypothetical protein